MEFCFPMRRLMTTTLAADVTAVVELAMEERTIRALGIAYQVDPERLLRAYRQRVRAAAWEIRREFEAALHDGDDPGGGE